MMTTIESYMRMGQNKLRKWAIGTEIHRSGKLAGCFLGGFLYSGTGLAGVALPVAMGWVTALSGLGAVLAALGAAAGYWIFWGGAGIQGILWTALGLCAALGLGKRRILEESPLLMPALAGLIVSASGLAFQIFWEDRTPVPQYLLRVVAGAFSAKLFRLVRERSDRGADWTAMAFGVMALARIPLRWLNLGYGAAGLIGAVCALPAAALAGLGLDLMGSGEVSMTAVLCICALMRLIPVGEKWLRFAAPGAVYLLVMYAGGSREGMYALPLALGGAAAVLIPPEKRIAPRRGETGMAQVRLEIMAQVLSQTRQMLLEEGELPIDQEALLTRARERACGSCPNRKTCRERQLPLPQELLENPLVETGSLTIPCKKPGRMMLELRRSQEQLRALRADRQRQREYRGAVVQQYEFLEHYLTRQADLLPRRASRLRQRFWPEISILSAGREAANGDRCAAFAGTGCRYYIALCDGMGTGSGAAREGQSALQLLRQMLTGGFPAEYALRSVNSLLVLRGRAAAVTLDLAEVELDSGRVTVYKWGGAPSWLVTRDGAEKIGTATPPPGLSVSDGRESVQRLSLRRGEVLIMVSDGVEAQDALSRMDGLGSLPPGEAAAKLLELGAAGLADDATVAAVRLRPGNLSP